MIILSVSLTSCSRLDVRLLFEVNLIKKNFPLESLPSDPFA